MAEIEYSSKYPRIKNHTAWIESPQSDADTVSSVISHRSSLDRNNDKMLVQTIEDCAAWLSIKTKHCKV